MFTNFTIVTIVVLLITPTHPVDPWWPSHITNKPINLTPMPRKMSSKPSNKSNKKTRNSLLDLEIESTKLIKEGKKLDYQPL